MEFFFYLIAVFWFVLAVFGINYCFTDSLYFGFIYASGSCVVSALFFGVGRFWAWCNFDQGIKDEDGDEEIKDE